MNTITPNQMCSYTSFCIYHSIQTQKELYERYNDIAGKDGMKLHIHNTAEVLLVLKGQARIYCEDSEYELKAPYIAYYPAYIPHIQDNTASELYERYCFPIIASDIGAPSGLGNKFFAYELTETQLHRLRSYIDIMYEHWGVTSIAIPEKKFVTLPHDIIRLRFLLLLFINELNIMMEDRIVTNTSYIKNICDYIGENFGSHLTIDTLSDIFFVGRAKLTKDFRRVTSMSVVEYITTVRLNNAKIMLSGDMSLETISERCGFSSVSYFLKVFKKHNDITPMQYRQLMMDEKL